MNVLNAIPTTNLFPDSFKALQVTLPSSTTSIYSLIHSPAIPLAQAQVLLLLHGYPQNHTLWHEMIPSLAAAGILKTHIIIIPDLPGYGKSTKPAFTNSTPSLNHSENSKKVVAGEMIALVDELIGKGKKFSVCGHDRGARVGFKMSKDYSDRITGFCAMDIVPTTEMFNNMALDKGNHSETFKSYHWIFLALPSPLPETLIGNDPHFYIDHTIESWTGTSMKLKHNPIAMNSWTSQYNDKAVTFGALEDYRAGAGIDMEDDAIDVAQNGGKVEMELLILYSVHLGRRFDVEGIWNKLAGKGIKVVKIGDEGTGHFLPVEANEQTSAEVIEWLGKLQE